MTNLFWPTATTDSTIMEMWKCLLAKWWECNSSVCTLTESSNSWADETMHQCAWRLWWKTMILQWMMSSLNHNQNPDYPLSLGFLKSWQVNTMTEPQIMPWPIPSTSCPIQLPSIILPFVSMIGATLTIVNELPKFGKLLYFNSILVKHPEDGRKSDWNM